MKITILALHLGFGGVEKYVITIANILSAQHDVEIISTYRTTAEPSFPLSEKVKVHYLIEAYTPNKEELKKAFKSYNVMSIVREGVRALKVIYLKNKENKKAILNCQSDIIISTRDFHNECIQKYASKKIITISTEHNHPSGNEKYASKIVKSVEGFDYFLPISKELCMFYEDKLKMSKTKVLYLPFCVDTPTCQDIPSFENPVYINVGRLSKEKGTRELIDVFNEIVKHQPEAILHLVGDGPLMDDVRDRVKALSLEERVIIHGFLSKTDIDLLYCKSSVFLMTSHTESFGFVLLEAMSCGIPCIAFSSAQGAHEIIKEGANGYLIEDRDAVKYIDTALSLTSHKQRLKEMSMNAKQCIDEYSFNNTKVAWSEFMETIKNEHSI